MGFNEPLVLLLLLILPAITYYYIINQKKKRNAALRFSSLSIIKSSIPKSLKLRTHLPFTLLIISITLLIIALSDPMIPLLNEKEGVNVILVIDDSGSMAATDYQPTRLESAKSAAELLINSLEVKDNVGIIIFESGATTASYLTPYKDKAIASLRSIKQKDGPTAIGDGLSLAVDMATSVKNKRKVIILLSDGVNNAGVISPQEAIQFAKVNNIQVHTIGLGSSGKTILGYDFFGNPQYAELDEATLQLIASETGGEYHKSVDSTTLKEIYQNIGENLERDWEDTSIKDWFIIASLITLLINFYVIYGRFKIIV